MWAAMVPPQFYCNVDNGDCPTIAVPSATSVAIVPTWQYVNSYYGFSYDDRWLFVLTTFLFAVGFRIFAMLATRFVSHLKR